MNERIKGIIETFARVGTDAVIVELARDERFVFDGRLARYVTVYENVTHYFSSLERGMVWAHMANLSAVVIGGSVTRSDSAKVSGNTYYTVAEA